MWTGETGFYNTTLSASSAQVMDEAGINAGKDSSAGIQRYSTNEQDEDSREAQENLKKTNAAVGVSTKKNKQADKAGLNPTPKPKPTSGGAGSAASASGSGSGHWRDGVVPGSFWGDVTLFAGAIFAFLVLVYAAVASFGEFLAEEGEAVASDAGNLVEKGVQEGEKVVDGVWHWITS